MPMSSKERRAKCDAKKRASGLYRTSVWIPQTEAAREALNEFIKRLQDKYGDQKTDTTAE